MTTYNALNDVTGFLTERGRILPSDFPSHFSSRCVRLPDFIAAVNAEFTALLMRRQYTRQLDNTRQSAKEQYARLSELLSESADQIGRSSEEAAVPVSGTGEPACEICTAVRPKAGESVSGDTVSTFRTDDGKVFLLLSDGMGCGEDARRESAMTVRLLEQFLKAGIEPPTALKTLNTALALHSDESGSFTTIDLMALTLRSGSASFYKYGAAPSYIKHGVFCAAHHRQCAPRRSQQQRAHTGRHNPLFAARRLCHSCQRRICGQCRGRLAAGHACPMGRRQCTVPHLFPDGCQHPAQRPGR